MRTSKDVEILRKIRAGYEISRASKDGTLDHDIAKAIIKLPAFKDWNRFDGTTSGSPLLTDVRCQ